MRLKVLVGCLLVVGMLMLAAPALALSIGASPTHIELEVPSNGSAVTTIQIHYFTGDVKISLIDIPLRVEPQTIHVDASSNPVPVELTIYGDNSLGSQTYDGYIRFVAVSGGAATGGVQVIAKVTNVVDEQLALQEPTETPSSNVGEQPVPTSGPQEQGVSTVLVVAVVASLLFLGLLAAVIIKPARKVRRHQ